MRGGYIGESLLQFKFEEYLEKLNETFKLPPDTGLFECLNKNKIAKRYLYNQKPEIQEQYINDRRINTGTLTSLVDNLKWKSSEIHKICLKFTLEIRMNFKKFITWILKLKK